MQAGTLDALAVAAGVPSRRSSTSNDKAGCDSSARTEPDPRATSRHAETRNLDGRTGTYPSLRTNYATVGLYNFAVAHRELPADLAYAILEAVFANHDELVEVHSAATPRRCRRTSPATPFSFHDGASRWYQNKGVLGVVRGD